jgi:murein DD-endopeptidase MepM/ murein hydrolase activator NlpD
LFLFLCIGGAAYSDESPGNHTYPLIGRLRSSDSLYKEYSAEVARAYTLVSAKALARLDSWDSILSELKVYRHPLEAGEDYLTLAARSNVGREALISLNHLEADRPLSQGELVLLPTIPGLYIPENPQTELEKLLASNRSTAGALPVSIYQPDGSVENFRFLPGAEFNRTEWTFFLTPQDWAFPLRTYTISSSYGYRSNPLTGNYVLHEGLDLAAPEGTPVYPARAGLVSSIVYDDPLFGNYILIQHDSQWQSLYGHLSSVDIALNSSVTCATIIGRVGSTGQSTGPHLHFELLRGGTAQNPENYLE